MPMKYVFEKLINIDTCRLIEKKGCIHQFHTLFAALVLLQKFLGHPGYKNSIVQNIFLSEFRFSFLLPGDDRDIIDTPANVNDVLILSVEMEKHRDIFFEIDR